VHGLRTVGFLTNVWSAVSSQLNKGSVSILNPEELRAARDWSQSVQARLAEKLAAEIALDSQSSDQLEGEHREKVEAVALASGMTQQQVIEMLSHSASEKVGELDEPKVRDQVQKHADDLFDVMRKMGMEDLSDRIMFGSLPSGQINALCCRNSWDPLYHILVDSDVLILCSSISKIVTACLIAEDGALASREELVINASNPEIWHRVADLFQAAVFMGTVKASKPFLPPSRALKAHAFLMASMARFVVAHEISHVSCKHDQNDEASISVATPDLPNVNALLFSREAEFEADAAGALISVVVDKAHGVGILNYAAPYIFMRSLHILQVAREMVGQEDTSLTSTHPKAELRAKFLRKTLIDKLPIGPDIAPVLDKVDVLFSLIDKMVMAEIARGLASGRKPRKITAFRIFEERPKILG
jgi:hypothetical protein